VYIGSKKEKFQSGVRLQEKAKNRVFKNTYTVCQEEEEEETEG
jgi:hypothetical protein